MYVFESSPESQSKRQRLLESKSHRLPKKKQRETDRERERERERGQEREREQERERGQEREREQEREKEIERETEREYKVYICIHKLLKRETPEQSWPRRSGLHSHAPCVRCGSVLAQFP